MAITLKDVAEQRRKIEESRKKLKEQEDALRVLENMISEEQISGNPQSEIDLNALPVEKKVSKQSLTEAVREVIQRFGNQEFGVVHVESVLKQQGKSPKGKTPRARIAMVMSTLEENGEVIRTFKGTGSEPHKFKLKNVRLVENG